MPTALPHWQPVQAPLAQITRELLEAIGEDTNREGLKDTPKRFAHALEFLVSGQHVDLSQIVGDALYHEGIQEMVLIKDIEFFSLCEHHLLPFYGRIHVAYLADRVIIGLSKVGRLVNALSRRLQVQERLSGQIADEMVRILNPQGVAILADACHLCMMMRGVQKQSSRTITTAYRGRFRDDATLRHEFLTLLQPHSSVKRDLDPVPECATQEPMPALSDSQA